MFVCFNSQPWESLPHGEHSISGVETKRSLHIANFGSGNQKIFQLPHIRAVLILRSLTMQ